MLRADKEKVYIEHCISCKSHTWCTNHDEEKYKEYFTRCQASISRTCYNVTVVENVVPEGFTDQFITDPNTSKPGKFHFPRIGSFEVYFRGVRIFSKIESMKWPYATKVAEKIKEIQDTPPAEAGGRKRTKPKRIKSAFPGKKRKTKKSKKKLNRRKMVETEKPKIADLGNYEKPRKKFEEIFKDRHSSSDSSSRHKNSDSEQPVPPYDYYQYQAKAKTPPRHLDSFGRAEDLKAQPAPEVRVEREKTPEVQKNVRQVAKVEIPSSQSSGSEDSAREGRGRGREMGKGRKSSSEEYDSESYESNPDIENIDLAGHLKRNEGQKEFVQSSAYSDQEYKSEDYEKYQSESESEEKGGKDRRVKDKAVDRSSSSAKSEKDYQEDYEKSSKSGKSSKSSKSSKSDKSDQSDYDQDFEENEEQHHPLRPADKSFPVTLILGEECRKKITYENASSSDALFIIKSSHPELMSIKDEEILIKRSTKDKIQLRFAPLLNECEKKYYIYITKDNLPWECIEIVATYE